MEAEAQRPDIPTVRWSKLLEDQQAFRHIFRPHLNTELSGSVFQSILGGVKARFPASVSLDVIQLSLSHLVGARITEDAIEKISDQLAAQYPQIATGTPLTLSYEDLANTWVAAVVKNAFWRRRGKEGGMTIRFRVLTSVAAPVEIVQWWSDRKTKYLANFRDERRHGFGFNYERMNKHGEVHGGPPFISPKQFYNLRCFIFLQELRGDRWATDGFGHTSSTMTYNQKLIRGRDRDISPCAVDVLYNKSCWLCPMGLDVCRFATHPMSYVETKCAGCGTAGYFAREQPLCDACLEKG